MTIWQEHDLEPEEPIGFRFYLEGHPSSDHRIRISKGRGYKSQGYQNWVNRVGWAAKEHKIKMIEGHLVVALVFFTSRFSQTDVDNLAKGVLDGLEGIGYENDSQITGLIVLKARSSFGEGVFIRVDKATETPPIWDSIYDSIYIDALERARFLR